MIEVRKMGKEDETEVVNIEVERWIEVLIEKIGEKEVEIGEKGAETEEGIVGDKRTI